MPAYCPAVNDDARAALRSCGLCIEAVADATLIIGEAFSNAVRHSRGQSATVSIRQLAVGVALRVADDGQGADLAGHLAREIKEHEDRLLNEDGRGLLLIHGLAAVVRLRRRVVFAVVR